MRTSKSKSKSRTFNSGEDYYEVFKFINSSIDRSEKDFILTDKYSITIIKVDAPVKAEKFYYELVCPECRKSFKSIRNGNFYCSPLCYNRAYRRKYKYDMADKKREWRKKKANLVLEVKNSL